MLRTFSLVGVSFLTLVFASSPAVGIDIDKETGDDANGVPIGLFLSNQAASPDNSAFRINNNVINQVDDRFADYKKSATAGMESSKEMSQVAPAPTPVNGWFSHPFISVAYNYINSEDKRPNGADSQTNAAVMDASVFTKYDILLGLSYLYSHRDAGVSNANLPTKEDSNFISIYLAKSFWQWMKIGVSGGYGYTSTALLGWDTGNENTWNVSPFIILSHSWGPFYTSLTTAYQYIWTNIYGIFPGTVGSGSDDKSGRINVEWKLRFAVTEKLTVQATAAYTGMTNYEPAPQNPPALQKLSEAHNWATFGAKLTYRVIGNLDVFAGYAYDAFNSSYSNQNVRTGLSYSW